MTSILHVIKKYLEYIETLDTQKIIQIVIGICLSIGIMWGVYTWRYIAITKKLQKSLNVLNQQREEARILREKMLQVQNQRQSVDRMLEQEKDFKIAGYMTDLLTKLKLSEKKRMAETSQTDVQETYKETEMTLSLIDMNMQQLVELLYAIEQKERLYIKRLEIERSKKQPSSIEVQINIATLIAI